MKCSLCGWQFSEKEAAKSCAGCILAGSCKGVKCPNCGYESPFESNLIRKIKDLIQGGLIG
jgi:rubredoxin